MAFERPLLNNSNLERCYQQLLTPFTRKGENKTTTTTTTQNERINGGKE